MVFAPSWAEEELGSPLTKMRDRTIGIDRPPEDDPFALQANEGFTQEQAPPFDEQSPSPERLQPEAPQFTQDAIAAAQGQQFDQGMAVIDAYQNALAERNQRAQMASTLIDTGLPAYEPFAQPMQGGSSKALAEANPPISYGASFDDVSRPTGQETGPTFDAYATTPAGRDVYPSEPVFGPDTLQPIYSSQPREGFMETDPIAGMRRFVRMVSPAEIEAAQVPDDRLPGLGWATTDIPALAPVEQAGRNIGGFIGERVPGLIAGMTLGLPGVAASLASEAGVDVPILSDLRGLGRRVGEEAGGIATPTSPLDIGLTAAPVAYQVGKGLKAGLPLSTALRRGALTAVETVLPTPNLNEPLGTGRLLPAGSADEVVEGAARAIDNVPAGFVSEPPPFPRPSTLSTVDDISAEALRQSQRFERSIVGQAGQLPVVRTAVDLVNPSALVAAPPKQLVDSLGLEGAAKLQADLLGHQRRLATGNALASAIEDGIRQRARAVGLVMEDGRIVSVPGAPAMGDVFENPSRFKLTAAQRQFVDDVDAVLDDMNRVERRAGVAKNEIFSEEGRYFPRRVLAVDEEVNVRPPVKRLTGAKQGFQKGRYYEYEEEGIRNGVQYSSDIGARVGTRIRAGIKATADKELGDLVKPLGRTINAANSAQIGEMGTMVPAIGGHVFDMPVASRLIDVLGTRYPGEIERGLSVVNNVLRPVQAVGDMGYVALQGLASAFNNPSGFAKAVGYAFDALISDGRFYGRYVMDNSRQLERFVDAGLTWRGSELSLESAARGHTLAKVFGQGPLGRLGAGFENGLNVMALENAKAIAGVSETLGPSKVRQAMRIIFGDISGENSDAIAASIANKMTGRLSAQSLGINAAQRSLENNLAFAPNYYRASFGLLADAIQGGMRGAESRRVIAGLVGGAVTTHLVMAEALGQEPNLDPFSSKFLTVRVGDTNIGMGGTFYGFFRTVAEAAQNPQDLDNILSMKSPVTRWARGRFSPIISLAVDLAVQSDYLARDLKSPQQIIEHIASRALPLTAQTALKEGLTEAASQFFGLRAFPVSAYDVTDQLVREEVEAGKLPSTFKDSQGNEQPVRTYRDLVNASPLAAEEFDARHGKQVEQRLENARPETKEATKLQDDFKVAQEKRDADLLTTNPAQWRAQSSEQSRELGIRLDQLYGEGSDYQATGIRGIANEKYHKAIVDATDPETKQVNWDRVDLAVAAMSADEQRLLFETRLRGETAARKEYMTDLKELVPYFEQRDAAWAQMKRGDPQLEKYDSFEQFRDTTIVEVHDTLKIGWAEARRKVDAKLEPYSDRIGEQSDKYLVAHADTLLPLLDKYDYYVPTKYQKYIRR